MRNRLISLVLLLVFGCGLLAGPHPCQAQAAAPEAAEAAAESDCHSQAATPKAGPGFSSGSGEEDCCAGHGALCKAACQSAAIVSSGTLAFAALPSAQAETPAFAPALPAFAQGIDHIPLS
jgi:hypothetical protein